MKPFAAGLTLTTGLTGCNVISAAADNPARDRAKVVVNGVVDRQLPGVNAAPVTDCVVDAASANEILTIAGASASGVTQSTVDQVLEIAQRREAVQCIAENSMTLFGG